MKELGRELSAGAEIPKLRRRRAGHWLCQPAAAGVVAQSPVIIISGEQATSYGTACCRCLFSGAVIAGNLVLARLTARRTVRSLIIMGGWPIMFGLILCGGDRGLFPRLSVDDGRSELLRLRIGLANAGLVRLTLFASEMSKGTVSAAMGMLQMLIFTVGIGSANMLTGWAATGCSACLTCWVGYYGWG